MISYSKRYVNIISIFVTIIIFVLINNINIEFNPQSILKMFKKNIIQVEINTNNINQNTNENKKIEKEIQNNYPKQKKQIVTKEEEIKDTNWKIIIPSIGLEAPISDGTSKEVMNKYVGHFDETSKTTGNIGLAAHNRGYEVNYFSNLKKLKEGDKIIYKYKEFTKTYLVKKHVIITDEDWSYLETTEKNVITLITCVENEPNYRRCIQASEM